MSDLAHSGRHANCVDCETFICADCQDGDHVTCIGVPCFCDECPADEVSGEP